jgi:NAD(P)-dependent dehydrogenase (short-subunit alcohol dehydrogenase family)
MSKQLIVLITGANRGLGLALTRAYLERDDRVVAASRHVSKAAPELSELKEIHRDDLLIVRMDVNLGRAVAAAAEEIALHLPRIDVLINNAAIAPGRSADGLETLELAQVRDAFDTNALGPIRTVRSMLPLLRRSKQPRVVNVSSGAGSLSRKAGETFNYAYAGSKAALNMFTRIMATELKEQGICVVAMTPGWLRTDMGGPHAEADPAEAAAEMTAAIDGLTMEQTSQWLDRRGQVSEYAW